MAGAETIDWTLPLLVLAIGLILGALFVWRARRGGATVPHTDQASPLELRDLAGRRDALVAQLRELDDTSKKFTTEQRQSEQATLERELARVLMALDEHTTPAERAKTAAVTASGQAANSTLKGFLWGAASAAAIAGLFLWVGRSAQPRAEGGSATGTVPMRSGAEGAAPAAPQSDDERALQAAVDKNPEDFDARIGLAQAALGKNDMMAIWNQTQYVLQKQPGEPRALTYQALVRVAMGQPDLAVKMLQQALETSPDLQDAYVHLALVYLRMGKTREAEQAIEKAKARFPEDAPLFAKVFADMRKSISDKKEMAAALPPGPDNPHSKLGGAAAPVVEAPVVEAPAPAAPRAASGNSAHGVSGTIDLDPTIRQQVAGGGVLFVLARAAGVTAGPPTAVKRLVPAGFPLTFELGDGDSMTGQPLPDKLRIEARLDADGDAATRDPSDPKGALDNVAVGTSGLKLVLSR